MIKSLFLCRVVIHFALIVRKNYPSMASSSARTTRVHIRSVLTNCQLTIKYWLDCRWRLRPTRRSAAAKWPRARYSTVQHIPRKRSSSTACKTVRCSVRSVSWNMLSKSTKSLIAHPKVRIIWNTISSLRSLSNSLTQLSFLVLDMQRMVQEMINEVEVYENETPASEELYSKLELKVRKKFNDEIDRLEKSFRRIME